MIQGEYDYGNHVFIDSKYTYDQSDIIFHELTHHAVTQGSLYGVLEIVLKRISIWHVPELTSVISELSNASLTAQEMTAIYAQCLYYKRQGGETLSAYEKYLYQSDYYRKYCISGFDEIVHYSQDDIDGTALLTAIAVMALNVDLTLAEIDWKDSLQVRKLILENPSQYYVNYRYSGLVKAALKLIRRGEEITRDKLLQESSMICRERTYENLSEMLQRLSRQLSACFDISQSELDDWFDKIIAQEDNFEGKPDLRNIEQRVIPKLLNDPYVYPPIDANNLLQQMNTVIVTLYDKSFEKQGIGTEGGEKDILTFHHAAAGWRFPVVFNRDETIRFLSEFQGEIVAFTEDYDRLKQNILLPAGKRIFYFYEGKWDDFAGQIRSQSVPYIHFHEVNPLINCIFVINENQEVFFTLQFKIITKYIIEDLREGKMIYANMEGNNTEIKDCFYLEDVDWCRYENVIVAMINRNFMDFSEGFPVIGGRIDIR